MFSKIYPRRRAIFPSRLCLGTSVLDEDYFFPIDLRYFLTEHFLTTPPCRYNAGAHLLRKYLEEQDGVFNDLEVGVKCSQLKNLFHCFFVFVSFLYTVSENPWQSGCCTAQQSATACSLTAGGGRANNFDAVNGCGSCEGRAVQTYR